MENKLNEMQQLRLLLAQRSNFDLQKAKEIYNFVIDGSPDIKAVPENVSLPDGVYFILSINQGVPAMYATEEDKKKAIAVGYKLGNRFANVVLHDAAEGEEIALCLEDEHPCGSEEHFHDSFKKAIADLDGIGNTQRLKEVLNPEIGLKDGEYVPSVAEFHLLLLFINEVNAALVEAGGEPLKKDWYWSSTEHSSNGAWLVNFNLGNTNSYYKSYGFMVRPAVAYRPL